MPGSFLGAVYGGLLRLSGQKWYKTFGTGLVTGSVAASRDLPEE